MAKRFVRAQPNLEKLIDVRTRLDEGAIEDLKPFSRVMTKALENARFDPTTDEAVWIQEDYCSPPLAMERAEVLEQYFTELIIVEKDVDEPAAWQRIDDLPSLWGAFSSISNELREVL